MPLSDRQHAGSGEEGSRPCYITVHEEINKECMGEKRESVGA